MSADENDLDGFAIWCAARGHYVVAALVQNFRNYKAQMRELETSAKLHFAGRSDEHISDKDNVK